VGENTNVSPDEILVLKENPISLSPVAGIVMTNVATPLSHVNILARSWAVPNAFIRDGAALFKRYEGQWVSFETRYDSYELRPADAAQISAYQQRVALRRKRMTPRADLAVKRLASLREQRAAWSAAYGAKSANLGELLNSGLTGLTVPEGFTVPFFYYDQFIRENQLQASIRQMLADGRFSSDMAYRRERLAQLRAAIVRGHMNADLEREVLRRVQAEYAGKGLFVRSSSNTEDLPNFSGAGLYTTVPNVRTGAAVIEAIKTVWASLWNFEAYEAREHAGVDHSKAMMAVLLQEGINADSAGVMITVDPFNPEKRGVVYINAKSGLGIKVVEGKRVAEQIIYNPRTDTIQILTRSAEDSLLKFDERGGVREVPLVGPRTVLTDDFVRRLAGASAAIKRVFGDREQDIEWVQMGGRLYIVQARPYTVKADGL
jgi:phosphoenolpyruvate synthase/pyruvate phosphate dikinase